MSGKLFDELDLPAPKIAAVRLPLLLWVALGRMLWFIGLIATRERRSDAVKRARRAADELETAARLKGQVTLVGHGRFNALLGKVLKKRGWQRQSRRSSRYWKGCSYLKV